MNFLINYAHYEEGRLEATMAMPSSYDEDSPSIINLQIDHMYKCLKIVLEGGTSWDWEKVLGFVNETNFIIQTLKAKL